MENAELQAVIEKAIEPALDEFKTSLMSSMEQLREISEAFERDFPVPPD